MSDYLGACPDCASTTQRTCGQCGLRCCDCHGHVDCEPLTYKVRLRAAQTTTGTMELLAPTLALAWRKAMRLVEARALALIEFQPFSANPLELLITAVEAQVPAPGPEPAPASAPEVELVPEVEPEPVSELEPAPEGPGFLLRRRLHSDWQFAYGGVLRARRWRTHPLRALQGRPLAIQAVRSTDGLYRQAVLQGGREDLPLEAVEALRLLLSPVENALEFLSTRDPSLAPVAAADATTFTLAAPGAWYVDGIERDGREFQMCWRLDFAEEGVPYQAQLFAQPLPPYDARHLGRVRDWTTPWLFLERDQRCPNDPSERIDYACASWDLSGTRAHQLLTSSAVEVVALLQDEIQKVRQLPCHIPQRIPHDFQPTRPPGVPSTPPDVSDLAGLPDCGSTPAQPQP